MTIAQAAVHSITPDTGINMSIAVALSAILVTCGVVVRATWKVSNLMRDLKDIAARLNETWSYECMKDWTHDLERKNRSIKPSLDGTFALQVPDPQYTRAKTEGRAMASGTNPPL
jgi:hypothetical protein